MEGTKDVLYQVMDP